MKSCSFGGSKVKRILQMGGQRNCPSTLTRGPDSVQFVPANSLNSLNSLAKEREEARALRTDRGERLAVRRSPTRFRCAFFGPWQLHARRSGRCAGGGVAPIALASGAKLRACQVRTAAAQIAPGGAKCDFSPSDAESHLRGCLGRASGNECPGSRNRFFAICDMLRFHILRHIGPFWMAWERPHRTNIGPHRTR